MPKNKSFFQKHWSWLVSLGVVAILVSIYFAVPGFRDFIDTTWSVLWSKDEEKIIRYFKDFGFWGPLLLILVMAVQMFTVVFPNMLTMLVAMLGYGPVWGSVISILGNIVSSTIGYFVGKAFRKKTETYLLGKEKYKKWQEFLNRYGFGAVVLCHVSPFISNDAISFIAGMIGMSYWRYMAATMAGAVPFTITVAWFAKDIEKLEAGLYWIGGGGIVVYLIYIWLDKKKKSKKK